MKAPRDDHKAGVDERSEPPDFDALTPPAELVRGDRTRDNFFDAVLGLTTPSTVEEVAERADHGRDAAREYLEWFEGMGVVTRVSDSPRTYKRNGAYFTWRRAHQLREEYSTEKLLSLLATETDRDEAFRETFGVSSPSTISISEHATETNQSVESVWSELSDWQTTRRRIELLETALRSPSEESTQSTVV